MLLKNQEDIESVRGPRVDRCWRVRCSAAPDRSDVVSTLLTNVLVFARVLRAAGLDVHHGRVIDAVRALEMVGLGA